MASARAIIEDPQTKKMREWIFKPVPENTHSADKQAEYLKAVGVTKACHLYENSAYGQDTFNAASASFPKAGIQIVFSDAFDPKATEFPQLAKAKASGCEAVVIGAIPPASPVMNVAARDAMPNIRVIHGHGSCSPDLVKAAGKAAEGTVMPCGKILVADTLPDTDPAKALHLKLIKDYTDATKSPISTFAGHAYDSLQLAIAALKTLNDGGTLADQRKAVRDALETKMVKFPTTHGLYTITANDHLGFDAAGFLFVCALLVLIVWIQMVQPAGLSLAQVTGGLLTLDTMTRVGLFTIILVGLNLLMGYAGQVSLGQAAFYGMGAFFSAIMTTRGAALGIPEAIHQAWWYAWLVMFVGMVLVGVFAYFIGLPVLRLRGHYLAMATLGIGIAVYILLKENLGVPHLNLTGGFDGVFGIPRLRIGDFVIWPVERYLVLVWVFTFIVIVLGLNIVNSRYGRVMRAIHSSQNAAESVGVAVHNYKAQIFAPSAALASLAGSLYAHFQAAVIPATFGFGESLELVVMSSVGGLASIWGAPFGSFAILILREVLRTQLRVIFPAAQGELEAVAFGLILVAIMIFMPEGLTTGSINRYRRWRAARVLKREISESLKPLGVD